MSGSAKKVIKKMKKLFQKHGDPARKANYERYFKDVVKYHGLLAKDIMKLVFKPIFEDVSSYTLEKQNKIAFKMMESEYGDEKKIGVEIMAKNVKKIMAKGERFLIRYLRDVKNFVEDNVYDWGTADILFLCELIKLDEEDIVAQCIAKWKDSTTTEEKPNSWLQRIACVSFVKIARKGDHNDVIIEIVSSALQNRFRFTQLGAGWVLRELSLADLDLVVDFIKDNYSLFIREGLRYAIEKMEEGLRQELLNYHKTGKKRKRKSKSKKEKKRRKRGK